MEKIRLITTIITLTILVLFAWIAFFIEKDQQQTCTGTEMECGLVKGIQIEREITIDNCLQEQARKRAEFIYDTGEFSHEPQGIEPWWYIQKCISYRLAGENLTKGYDKFEEAHKALMESPGHRKNILNKNFQKIGVGCYENICVEFFSN